MSYAIAVQSTKYYAFFIDSNKIPYLFIFKICSLKYQTTIPMPPEITSTYTKPEFILQMAKTVLDILFQRFYKRFHHASLINFAHIPIKVFQNM